MLIISLLKNIMNIDITFQLQSLNDEVKEIIVKGTIIYHEDMYIVTVHKGLPIIKITINNIIIDDIINCKWNDLLLIKVNPELFKSFSEIFVFKQFVKKRIDTTIKINDYKFIRHNFQ